jgi:hypothetical protein
VTTHLILRPASNPTRILTVAVPALLAACMLGACSDKSGGAQAEAKKAVPTVPVLIGKVVE